MPFHTESTQMISKLMVELKLLPAIEVERLLKSKDVYACWVYFDDSTMAWYLTDNQLGKQPTKKTKQIKRIEVLQLRPDPERLSNNLELTIIYPKRKVESLTFAISLICSVSQGYKISRKDLLVNLIRLYLWENFESDDRPMIATDPRIRSERNANLFELEIDEGEFYTNEWFGEENVDYRTITDFMVWAFGELKKVSKGIIFAAKTIRKDKNVAFELFGELFMTYWRSTNSDTAPALRLFVSNL